MSVKAALAVGYAVALVLGAFLLEWLSAHTHRRSLRYRTAGFDYQAEHDLWVCPEGEQLWPKEFDRERRLVRYRARAAVCNACPRKADCTHELRKAILTLTALASLGGRPVLTVPFPLRSGLTGGLQIILREESPALIDALLADT